jgi:hypothetical protein
MHLGLECIPNFIFVVFPRKVSQIVLKFGPETDNIMHSSSSSSSVFALKSLEELFSKEYYSSKFYMSVFACHYG